MDMKKTYTGNCHCGAVRFECAVDLAEATSRCNCSICSKTRFWKAVMPDRDFRLLAGETALTEYMFGENIRHFFCATCGVKTFGRGDIDEFGPFHAVNLMCLDASDDELAAAPVLYENGRDNRWDQVPAQTRHL
jgi:hypothetical protein